jgi:hypothetical protein
MNELNIGLIAEGPTDIRFLESVIRRTYENVISEHNISIIITLYPLNRNNYKSIKFVDIVKESSKDGFDRFGVQILCVHTDADSKDASQAYKNKINPSIIAISKLGEEFCKNIVAVVPIQMSEAWMLADFELLKKEIGTTKSNEELKLKKKPEEYTDPKIIIEESIRISRADSPKRRRKDLKISDLYRPLGAKISLNKLERLESYIDFKRNVIESLKKLAL